jgi:cytochrome c oxidase subunit I
MFVSGQSALATTLFSLLTFAVSIPSAIKVFNWLATMYRGSIWLKTPMLYALGFILLFGIGGLTGLFLGSLATNIQFHGTYFVVAHFHYVMVGGTLFAFLGGMHYWWPKMFGRMYDEFWAGCAAVLIFIGFNFTFMPQFIAGAHGLPRRYAEYPAKFTIYNQISTIGACVLAVGLIITAVVWAHSLFRGEKAPANPWGANTLEWHTTSPPPPDNFARPPVAGDPYDLGCWKYDEATQQYLLRKEEGDVSSAK